MPVIRPGPSCSPCLKALTAKFVALQTLGGPLTAKNFKKGNRVELPVAIRKLSSFSPERTPLAPPARPRRYPYTQRVLCVGAAATQRVMIHIARSATLRSITLERQCADINQPSCLLAIIHASARPGLEPPNHLNSENRSYR